MADTPGGTRGERESHDATSRPHRGSIGSRRLRRRTARGTRRAPRRRARRATGRRRHSRDRSRRRAILAVATGPHKPSRPEPGRGRGTGPDDGDALEVPVRFALVLGGDCTIGIGTVAGARSAVGAVWLLYFDLHADLNTPASVGDGALDWMALAHMLAIGGSEPSLAEATGRVPIIDPDRVVLFGHGRAQATGWERNQIKRLDLARFAVEDVAIDPEAVAADALRLLKSRAERYVIHLDVDVVDFTDAPLSEHTSRNTGLPLGVMFRALKVLAAGEGLVAITVTELNPKNAAAEDGLLERFTESLAAAIA